MNHYWRISFALFTCLAFLSGTIKAQNADYGWEAGIGVGTTIYQGDLAPSAFGNFKRLKPALSIYFGKTLSPYVSVGINYSAGKVAASDADYPSPKWRKDRNLNFSSPINELTAKVVFRPFGYDGLTPNLHFYPYIFAGAGAAFVNIRRDWSGISPTLLENEKTAQDLAADTMYQLPTVIPAIPVGAGVAYLLSPSVSLFGELTYHVAVTDYLDGFSNLGNSDKKDNYYMMAVGVHFNFSMRKSGFTKCPSVK